MAEAAPHHLLVLATAGSEEQATGLAQALVDRRLAACVNIVSQVCSVYRWKGEVCRDEEKLLLIKTSRERFDDLRAAIHELHTYELPDVIAVPIGEADPRIRQWLDSCVSPGGDSGPAPGDD